MNEKQLSDLERLSLPLIEYLRKNFHPYTAIVVTDERMAVVETVSYVPVPLEED